MPILSILRFDMARVRELSEGKTTLIEDQERAHIPEGVVVRPMEERTHPTVGRLILKYMSDDSLLDRQRSDYAEV